MDTNPIALQQAQLQANIAMAMVKKNAQADQKFVEMIAQNTPAPTSGRGQLLDVTV